jgi:hypothetical protein
MSEPTIEDYAKAQEAEYGTYLANGPIFHDGARAYNANDPVPVSNVDTYKYLEQGLVRRVDDPAPTQAAAEAAPLPVGDPIVINPDDAPTGDAEPVPTETEGS